MRRVHVELTHPRGRSFSLRREKGYIVHGIIRRSSSFNTGRIEHLFDKSNYKLTRSKSGESRLFLHYGDLSDTSNLVDVIRRVNPCEIYNLAAQSHVQVTLTPAPWVRTGIAHRSQPTACEVG